MPHATRIGTIIRSRVGDYLFAEATRFEAMQRDGIQLVEPLHSERHRIWLVTGDPNVARKYRMPTWDLEEFKADVAARRSDADVKGESLHERPERERVIYLRFTHGR